MPVRPYVLSIAGFDPSAGAGILADIKTFEWNKVYGLGICSANTFQNDIEFQQVDWMGTSDIIRQIGLLQKRFPFDVVKIGLVKSLQDLQSIVIFLKNSNHRVKIIWDPVLKASAGFEFHPELKADALTEVCRAIYLLTPNLPEAERLCHPGTGANSIEEMSRHCHVYLKGGHSGTDKATDKLFGGGNELYRFESDKVKNNEKHGSGCILSSAIAANLALGYDLIESCRRAKTYITSFIKSTDTLLGYHAAIK